MHAKSLTQVAVVGLALAALADASAQSARSAPAVEGPWIGVWRLNADKTAAANGRPRPAAAAATGTIFRMVVVRGDVFKYTMETVPADGAAPIVRAELIGRFDGQDYIEIGNPGADTNRFQIIDSRSYEVVDTKDGTDLLTIRVTISPDGRTRTSEARGRNLRGEEVHTISVYDRVP
jgi:hypothetical protein